jgi:ribonucleoside-diphosphate reductase alpha chain
VINLNKASKITEIDNPGSHKDLNQKTKKTQPSTGSTIRPQVVDAKVYKVKSAFVKNAVFITLSYVNTPVGRRPIEIFINSKDLNRAPEYVVLTRLISAIFRRATDPMFILEELHGIHDPNGGSFKDGKYYHSFYAEVAETIETFFFDVGIVKDKSSEKKPEMITKEELVPMDNTPLSSEINPQFRICPTCSSRALKTENGCDSCVECGYSKCDK